VSGGIDTSIARGVYSRRSCARKDAGRGSRQPVAQAVAGADLLSLRRAADSRGGLPARVAIGGQGTLGDSYLHLLEAQWGVPELRRFDVPLGALGAWNLFTTEREAAPAGAPEGRS
jgi:hypothetical protein